MEEYTTKGTCSSKIIFEVTNHKLTSLKFVGGCRGNTQGVSRLAVGRDIDEVISLLDGIECRKNTSCPDQLAQALKAYKVKYGE